MEYLNGVGILINPNRFEVIDKISKSQLIILELRDIMDDQRIIVVNTYINPTYQRRLPNKIILEEISQSLSTALINNRKSSYVAISIMKLKHRFLISRISG